MPHLVGVEIKPEFQDRVHEGWLRALAGTVLEREGPQGPVELGILVAGDEAVRELNRRYRGLDSATDVLSFALTEGGDFVAPPDGLLHLGEVIISYPQAERQAQERGVETRQEVALLLVHGILHLLGYDHADRSQVRHMKAKERALLQAILDHVAT